MAQGAPVATAARLSILVIDDDPEVRAFLWDFLTLDGFEVTTLADPSFAVDRIRHEMFHLILLDLMMPKIYGLDLLPQIRAVDDDIPVIIMCSVPSLETASESIRHGVSAYMSYPFFGAELREAIARIAKKKRFSLPGEGDLHVAIGRRLRKLRGQRGLTLHQVARRTSLSASLLSQIERGEASASASSLFAVATALRVRITDLLAGY